MANQYAAPWHRESYDRFLQERLPEVLAERLPLAGYRVEAAGEFARKVTVGVNGTEVTFADVPGPNAEGVFEVKGQRRVVVPTAYGEDLASAEVRCVGEQMLGWVRERLGEAPRDLKWDEAILRAWLPLDAWIREFIETLDPDYHWRYQPEWVTPGKEIPRVQPLDDCNWLSTRTHLRRVLIVGAKRTWVAGQLGRVCPFETPEGRNLGKVAHVAAGATIREGRIVIVDEKPEAAIGLTASMVPLLEHDEAARVMMGANMMRQWVAPSEPEAALVQTGFEPDAAGFWCGCNFLTAFEALGVETFEDGIVLSESAARRLSSQKPVEVGDKLSNRHGAKGVVSQIRPDAKMPRLEDGTAMDLVYSFIGLHTRLNFGQVREAVLGRVARKLGRPLLIPPFARLSEDEVRRRLKEAGQPESGMERLRVGEKPLERPSTVGWVYWGRTEHLSRRKLWVSTEPRRCMRQGENEYYGLRDAGAVVNVLETYNLRNAARADAGELAGRVAAGPVGLAEPPSPLFTNLARRLAAGGVLAEFEGGKVRFRFGSAAGVPEVVRLAQGVRHPWMRERELCEVGRIEGVAGWDSLVEVNERLTKLVASGAPGSLREKAAGQLQGRVDAYLQGVLEAEGPWARVTQPNAQVMFSGIAVLAPPVGVGCGEVGIAEEMAWGLFGPVVEMKRQGTGDRGQGTAGNDRRGEAGTASDNGNDHGPETAQDHGTRHSSTSGPACPSARPGASAPGMAAGNRHGNDRQGDKETRRQGETTETGQEQGSLDSSTSGGTPTPRRELHEETRSVSREEGVAPANERTAEETAALDRAMAGSWVIINRAPTTGPTSMMAFRPVRIAEPVIRMPVQVNRLMNADYDGDQAGVFLPVTAEGQREAGEKLTLLGHLRREPSILGQIGPYQEALWGLAAMSVTDEGLRRIEEVVGAAVHRPGGCMTHDSLLAVLREVLAGQGPERVLAAIDTLTRMGFAACGASGASISPFMADAVKRPVEPAGEDPAEWQVYMEELQARVASTQEFADAAIGAQLLAVRSGARGSVAQLARLVGPLGPAMGADGKAIVIRHSLGEGLTALESYALAAAMRERIGQLHGEMERTAMAMREGGQPKGFNVLARAARSGYPGAVFAQAAASGEVDPLTDLDARLFVGVRMGNG